MKKGMTGAQHHQMPSQRNRFLSAPPHGSYLVWRAANSARR
jgi:hypothetical protein